MRTADSSASNADPTRQITPTPPSVVFGARSDWGGVVAVHVAPVSGSDVAAVVEDLSLGDDLWEIGPRRNEVLRASPNALRRRRAVQLVHGRPPADACLVGDPSAAVTGALGVSLSSDRHATLYARDSSTLSAALGVILARRLKLVGSVPASSLLPLVRPTDDAWVDARVHAGQRLTVVRFRDVGTGDDVDRWVRSRSVGWRAGFAW